MLVDRADLGTPFEEEQDDRIGVRSCGLMKRCPPKQPPREVGIRTVVQNETGGRDVPPGGRPVEGCEGMLIEGVGETPITLEERADLAVVPGGSRIVDGGEPGRPAGRLLVAQVCRRRAGRRRRADGASGGGLP
jgi:hypothetical protein